jgi:hypothetical protein
MPEIQIQTGTGHDRRTVRLSRNTVYVRAPGRSVQFFDIDIPEFDMGAVTQKTDMALFPF